MLDAMRVKGNKYIGALDFKILMTFTCTDQTAFKLQCPANHTSETQQKQFGLPGSLQKIFAEMNWSENKVHIFFLTVRLRGEALTANLGIPPRTVRSP